MRIAACVMRPSGGSIPSPDPVWMVLAAMVMVCMKTQHFPYLFDQRWSVLILALRVRDADGVTVSAKGQLIATFGRFKVTTPLDNIDHTVVTGPHRWYTAVGLRLSLTDDGITFGTNHRKGLSIAFVKKVPRVIGLRKHSSLWVSVADPEGLAALIESRR